MQRPCPYGDGRISTANENCQARLKPQCCSWGGTVDVLYQPFNDLSREQGAQILASCASFSSCGWVRGVRGVI
jgi:hypothetical protein